MAWGALAVVCALGVWCVWTARGVLSSARALHGVLSNARSARALGASETLQSDGPQSPGEAPDHVPLGRRRGAASWAGQLVREIAEAQTARQRRLAQNELVGLVDIERQRSKQVPAAFSRIAFFAAGFGAVVGLSAQLAYGRGWRAATTSLLVGFVAALACGGYGRAARAEARRLSVLTRSLTEFWESESTGVPSDGVKS